MKAPVTINGNMFVPVKQAAEQFGYSSDHITRLAKAKKIRAVQQGRFWFVNEVSLQNYFDDQHLEAEIKNEVLRKKRQIELQVRSALSQVDQRTNYYASKSAQLAGLCTCLLVALLLATASQIVPKENVLVASLGSVSDQTTASHPSAMTDAAALQPVFSDQPAVLVDESDRWIDAPTVTPQWVHITP